jgi:hypothetical protein
VGTGTGAGAVDSALFSGSSFDCGSAKLRRLHPDLLPVEPGVNMLNRLLVSVAMMVTSMHALADVAAPAAASGAVSSASVKHFVVPVYSQLLMFSYPDGFVPALQNENGGNFLLEMVPDGQTRQAWSEMVTVSGTQGLALKAGITPAAMADWFAGNFHKDCPDSFFASGFGTIKLSGYDAFAALISCGTSVPTGEPYSETTLFVVIKGASDLYTIQWAERGVASKTPLHPDEAKWTGRLKSLSPIKVCKIVPDEAPPYSSCLNQ